VFPDLTGVVVHDRYQNYDKFPGIIHQLCAAHLLRDLEDAAQSYPAAIWPGRRSRGRPSGTPAAVRHGVRVGLSQVRRIPGANAGQPPARLLLECLRDREDDVLRFLSDLRIPPTSNQAERDVRPAKVQQKISGRLRSEQATRHRCAIRGYGFTAAAKHGIGVFTALRDALTGNPWMPPIPRHQVKSARRQSHHATKANAPHKRT
jgi:transposase